MAKAIDDLWPNDIAPTMEQVPPVTILKQQAALLGRNMKNVIEGEVETDTADFQRFLRHTFYLVAPALNFYRYPLLTVEHDVTKMYPAEVTVAWQEKFPPPKNLADRAQQTRQKKERTARDEKEFKAMLKRIFADEETKKVIGALLAQSLGQQQNAK